MSDSETSTDEGSVLTSDDEKPRNLPVTPRTQSILPQTPKFTVAGRQITTLVQNIKTEGDKLSVVAVNVPGEQNATEISDKPKVLAEAKKVPLLIGDLLAHGPPYPWRKLGLDDWAKDRMTAHQTQLGKIGEVVTEEEEKIRGLQEEIDARKELLSLVTMKKTTGKMVLSQLIRTL